MTEQWTWNQTAAFFTEEIEAARRAGMLTYEEWLHRIFLKIAKYRQRSLGGNHETK